ncbi:ABC transporter substrate-binding protein [Homoserinibacter gongjuensis]|uniref:Sugar ABC transporter substrate-binding protein n=1 Tax=Homoserinibacter gongjuensis TaxID=1162968 RepID=A0ABQ6JVU9_9MICO|nr:extracellular solute-binding protein [Homoserinibacter gongjuensis]GMA91389.1 sugar ABC transporter substrate-binding protein [Homoserinibacter gongjuensis]
MTTPQRRAATAFLAVAATAGLLLSACAPTGGDDADEKVTLRLVWWGSDDRAAVTRAAVDAFEDAHPNITVETESLPFDGYFDRLSTQVAANDAPDVQQLTGDFVVEYGTRGALLDLANVSTDLLDPATTSVVNFDGEQLGVPTGIATFAIVANPTIFEQAGVPMPDDESWTWEEYAQIAQQISASTPDGIFGTQSLGSDSNQIAMWARQHGGDLFTADGQLGTDEKTVAGFYAFAKELVASGAAPSADEAIEQIPLGSNRPEPPSTATRWASGRPTSSSLEQISKSGLELLRYPTTSGKAGDQKMSFVASQYWSASARTEHPEEAQLLIDFLANSPEAGKLLLVGRGSPANSEVRDALLPLLSADDAKVVDFVAEISDEVVATPLAPAGGASFQENMRRYTAEVLFDRMSPEDASAALLDETRAALG